MVFAAFLVPINWSAAPRFLGLLVSSTVLTPDWASVAACCHATTRAPDWAGGHVMSSTVLTPDWASVAACCRATTHAPDWAGGHVMFTLDSAAPSLQDSPSVLGTRFHE